MKIKNCLIAFAVLAAGLTSCNNDDIDGPDKAGDFSMYMKIDKPETKADMDKVTDGKELTFSDGALIFADDAGAILHRYSIGSSGDYTVDQLKTGTVITQINANATKVHVYGNIPAIASSVTNISAINSIALDSQQDTDFGVAKASLYGVGAINALTGVHQGINYTHKAEIDVKSILSRLEVGELATKSTADIKSYKLAGIYINNYYAKINADGSIIDSEIVNYLQYFQHYYRSDITAYPDGKTRLIGIDGKYDPANYPYLFDDGGKNGNTINYVGNSDATGSVKPSNAVWAYNVFGSSVRTPHIVFHLLDVSFTDNSLFPNTTTGVDGEAYLTVTGYLEKGGSAFVNVEGGYVYYMDKIAFDEDDLGEVPEKNEKNDVLVEIKLIPWKVVPVDPSFD